MEAGVDWKSGVMLNFPLSRDNLANLVYMAWLYLPQERQLVDNWLQRRAERLGNMRTPALARILKYSLYRSREHIDAPVLRRLFVGQQQSLEIDDDDETAARDYVKETQEVIQTQRSLLHNVRPLKHFCRLSIRRALRVNDFEALPLPPRLIRYVQYGSDHGMDMAEYME